MVWAPLSTTRPRQFNWLIIFAKESYYFTHIRHVVFPFASIFFYFINLRCKTYDLSDINKESQTIVLNYLLLSMESYFISVYSFGTCSSSSKYYDGYTSKKDVHIWIYSSHTSIDSKLYLILQFLASEIVHRDSIKGTQQREPAI